jgi:hypothetical protein
MLAVLSIHRSELPHRNERTSARAASGPGANPRATPGLHS